MARGQFITFEGGEGAGKSTQILALETYLRSRGMDVVCTREPGGTKNAEMLRDLVVSGAPGRWSALEEMLIMYTARAELVRRVIEPALAAGKWVLSDRFFDSTFAYQGYAGGVALARIKALNQIILEGFAPDLTLILDVPPGPAMQRVHARGEEISRFEKHKSEFYEKVRNGYLSIAKDDPNRCKIIDGSRSIAQVSADIQTNIDTRFAQEFNQ